MRTFLVDHAMLQFIEQRGIRVESMGIAERHGDRLVRIDTGAESDWTSRMGRLYCGALKGADVYSFDLLSARTMINRCQLTAEPRIAMPDIHPGDRLFVYLEPNVFSVVDVH